MSVRAALDDRGGPLRGVEASAGGVRVRVDTLAFESEKHSARGGRAEKGAAGVGARAWLVARGEVSRGEQRWPLVSRDDRVHRDSPLFGLLAAGDARARAEAALAGWAASLDAGHRPGAEIDAGCKLADALANALLPEPEPGSLFDWVRREFAAWARGADGHLARVDVGGARWVLDLAGTPQAELCVVNWGMVYTPVEIRRDGQVIAEASLPPARLSLESLCLRAPAIDAPAVQSLREAWRAHLEQQLRAVAVAYGARGEAYEAIQALHEGECVVAVLEAWAVDGPPPPLARRISPAPDAAARAAGAIRRLPRAQLVDPRGRRVHATAAYALGSDLLLLRARGSGATEEEAPDDEIWLQRGGGRAVPLLARPGHAEFSRSVDGDAEALREVLAWLREVISRAGCDATFCERNFGAEWAGRALAELRSLGCDADPDDDAMIGAGEDPAGRDRRVSEWLKFERWPGHPTYDWRWPNDEIDGARSLLDEDAPGSPTAARREDVKAYYDFVRRWIDPRFVGRLECC